LEDRSLPAVLHVGPGEAFASVATAAAAAHDGDDIQIDAGLYTGAAAVATISANNLTIEGVGGKAHLDAAGFTISNLKGIFDITGNNITVRNLEFSGASVPDLNGAGIRAEGTNLTVTDCYFHDNQNGIDANGPPAAEANSTIDIERSEFAFNGIGSANGTGGHNIYIGAVADFILRDSYSHNANGSQLVKTRALSNYILYNRITDETGNSNYEVDVSQGGLTYLIGNLLEKAQTNNNHTFIVYDAEGASGSSDQNPIQQLYVINNTLVNDGSNFGTGIVVAGSPTDCRIENNIFSGNGILLDGPSTVDANNLVTAGDPGFVNQAGFDYHLTAGSAAIDAGTDPGSASDFGLAPVAEYVHPLSEQPRPVVGALDIGAYEFGNGNPPPNDLTVATPQSLTVNENGSGSGNVLIGAVDGEGAPITAVAGTFATGNGAVTINSDGTYTYTPNPGFIGSDSFAFTAQTADDTTNGTVNVTVTAPLPPPPVDGSSWAEQFADAGATQYSSADIPANIAPQLAYVKTFYGRLNSVMPGDFYGNAFSGVGIGPAPLTVWYSYANNIAIRNGQAVVFSNDTPRSVNFDDWYGEWSTITQFDWATGMDVAHSVQPYGSDGYYPNGALDLTDFRFTNPVIWNSDGRIYSRQGGDGNATYALDPGTGIWTLLNTYGDDNYNANLQVANNGNQLIQSLGNPGYPGSVGGLRTYDISQAAWAAGAQGTAQASLNFVGYLGGTPVVAGNTVVFSEGALSSYISASPPYDLVAENLNDGTVQWQVPNLASSPYLLTTEDGSNLCAYINSGQNALPGLHVLDLTTGRELWSNSSLADYGPVSLAYHGGYFYASTVTGTTKLSATTGAVVWQADIGVGYPNGGQNPGDFVGHLVLTDNTLWVAGGPTDQTVYGINTATGSVTHTIDLAALGAVGGVQDMVAADGKLGVLTDSYASNGPYSQATGSPAFGLQTTEFNPEQLLFVFSFPSGTSPPPSTNTPQAPTTGIAPAVVALLNQPVTLTATVAAVSPNSSTPTGTVTFTDTSTGQMLGTAPLNNGIATLPGVVFTTVGDHTIGLNYSGDGGDLSSLTNVIVQVL
jgi:hypothetical protein